MAADHRGRRGALGYGRDSVIKGRKEQRCIQPLLPPLSALQLAQIFGRRETESGQGNPQTGVTASIVCVGGKWILTSTPPVLAWGLVTGASLCENLGRLRRGRKPTHALGDG